MRRAAPIVVALFLAVAACTSGENRPTPPRPTPIPRGGTLVTGSYLFRGTNPTFDPQTAYNAGAWELFRCCLLRTLLSYNGKPTEAGGAILRPDLASELPEVSSDGFTWTFHIKRGIRYAPPLQDQEIVAGDVARALQRMAASSSGYLSYYSAIEGFDAARRGHSISISGLDVPNDSTLVVHLTHATGDLPFLFSFPATAPIPADPRDPSAPFGVATGHDEDYGQFLVASGPYMYEGSGQLDLNLPTPDQTPVSGFVPAVTGGPFGFHHGSLTLVRNPSWDPATDPLRPAYVDRIRLLLGDVPGDTKFPEGAVRNGSMDVMFDSNAYWRAVQAYEENPSRAGLARRSEVDLVSMLQMNMAVPPFDDVRVRKAVSLAIDKRDIVEIFGTSFVPGPGAVAHHLVPDPMEENLLGSYRPSWAASDPAGTGDLEAALAEMRRSAYDGNGDGRCDSPSCRDVRLFAVDDRGDQATWAGTADAIRSDLRPIGIHVRVVLLPIPEFSEQANEPGGHAPLVLDAWYTDYSSATTVFIGTLDRASIGTAGRFNDSLIGASPGQLASWGYATRSVPSAEEEIDRCSLLVGKAQVQCWAELDERLMETVVPWVPLEFHESVRTLSTRVADFSFDQFTGLPALDRIALAPGGSS
jgi:ABC-type transport system substrate-binding protein